MQDFKLNDTVTTNALPEGPYAGLTGKIIKINPHTLRLEVPAQTPEEPVRIVVVAKSRVSIP